MPGSPDEPAPGEALVLSLDGFEGPLDLLLALARLHRVDLTKLSMLALAEQYLEFVAAADRLRLEVAADYLVMAAWLAYLKSRLLLPGDQADETGPSGEELAQRLAFRLMRLEAMRSSAAKLMTRLRLGRDVFGRGMPEGVRTVRETTYTAVIYDLLQAYAEHSRRRATKVHVVEPRPVWSIKEARERLEALMGEGAGSWVQLDLFLERFLPQAEVSRTVLASSFGATLEMVREGIVEIRQEAAFAPIYVKRAAGRRACEPFA